ncbi:hypothetical protein [Bacillus alkalicellulosilyticus]|uniref:hypothetical protein n=1 Tax=Alkalihalobacterium alkalicellulosilyticum TaxID=1912214 RepID=UPI0009974FC1|nr:hypothetical protein [Bacillus alkalicellulosilyticus]
MGLPILISVATLLFAMFAGVAFYYAFKPFKERKDFFQHVLSTYFPFVALLGEAILYLCEKLFPTNFLPIFRVIVFIIGLLFIGLIALMWLTYWT